MGRAAKNGIKDDNMVRDLEVHQQKKPFFEASCPRKIMDVRWKNIWV
jgi:hypothetical protein